MRKYVFARSLAWGLVAAGLVFSAISLMAGVYGVVAGQSMHHGLLASAQTFVGVLGGFITALFGFVFHCIFDATEKYIRRGSDR